MSMIVVGLATVLATITWIRYTSRFITPPRPLDDASPVDPHDDALSVERLRNRRRSSGRRFVSRSLQRIESQRRRRRGILPADVATWCDALARRVRSGSTLRESVRLEVPADRLLADTTSALRLGVERGRPLSIVLGELLVVQTDRAGALRGDEHLTLAYSIITTASDLGGSAAAPLDRVGAALRLRSADSQERSAHSAQARLSAHVLTVVPLGIIVVLTTTDPAVRVVLTTPIGGAVLASGLVLNGSGWWWMRRIIAVGR